MRPLAIPTFLSAVVSSVMAILPGMTAAQATVVVMSMRNFWDANDPNYVPADFEHGILDHPISKSNNPVVKVDDEGLSDEDLDLFKAALGDVESTPDLDLVYNDPKRDLEIIAILSSVNTAVTVMVLGFLYMVGRPRSGAALALNMMYPIDIWGQSNPRGFRTSARHHNRCRPFGCSHDGCSGQRYVEAP